MVYSMAALLIAVLPAFALEWESPARFRLLLNRTVPGRLAFDNEGVEFRAPKFSRRWPFGEIKTFELSGARELAITDYGNRGTLRFTLGLPMPPAVAAELTGRVGRPVINGDPNPDATVIAELPAHRRERFGGSNGTLRLREDGIDYVADGRASRSWRWSDIQTLANPNRWEFRVTGYREIVEFDLKQPLSPELFDRVWDRLYAHEDHAR